MRKFVLGNANVCTHRVDFLPLDMQTYNQVRWLQKIFHRNVDNWWICKSVWHVIVWLTNKKEYGLKEIMGNIRFICARCGACCMNLGKFHGIYDDLDDGSGICKYFNYSNKSCSIYSLRPVKCRIEEGYDHFGMNITYSEYLKLTKLSCQHLQLITFGKTYK